MMVTKTEKQEVDNNYCEKLFVEKCHQKSDGRYEVPIPWMTNAPSLGNSYRRALACFLSQEKRWQVNHVLKKMCHEFMEDYATREHMVPIPAHLNRNETGDAYYIPWLSILRHDAVTTKLRNVFNASSKTSNGVSLNETILPGPKLQTHIFDVITRVRQFKYMYSADVAKMFRCFDIPRADWDKHRILWRSSPNEPIKEYWLTTVTYGTDCAPWQAIRTLRKIAEDHAPDEATRAAIFDGFYMDDLYDGGDTIENCQTQIKNIATTLEKGQLNLTKWMANHPDILHHLPENKKLQSYIDLDKLDPIVRTLGLQFHPTEDSFSYKIKTPSELTYTKRGMLSITAGIYDPVGWILPVIMQLRILIQSIWMTEVDWDTPINDSLKSLFAKSLTTLSVLESVRIPRWIQTYSDTPIEFVGFADASQDGYAAVLYSRTLIDNKISVAIVAARGRVTPVKTKKNQASNICTIPKFELEGILLLTQLFKEVSKSFKSKETKLLAYTDSEVALCWCQ